MKQTGQVYLVGAGPGDPELLTVKAVNILKKADAVVYDRLISTDILDLVPRGCARIFAGKAAGNHHIPQNEMNELLVALARSNRTVVRLKGGDPFVFGRGSEEAAHLALNNISFEVIPGITAAAGISAATGIPLTHRGLATGVQFVTGHRKKNDELDLDWSKLADPDTTLVCYMGLANLPEITAELIAAGLSPGTPAAAISKGTLAGQRQCVAPLSELSDKVTQLGFPSPVLCMIGRVVHLATELNWRGLDFEETEGEQISPARKVSHA